MKTNYKAITRALSELDAAAKEMNKVASLRIGMISGGPSIDRENAEFYSALSVAKNLVTTAIDNGARLSKLWSVCSGYNRQVSYMVKEAIQNKELDREYAKYCANRR